MVLLRQPGKKLTINLLGKLSFMSRKHLFFIKASTDRPRYYDGNKSPRTDRTSEN